METEQLTNGYKILQYTNWNENSKLFRIDENEDTTYLTPQDTMKSCLRVKFEVPNKCL